MKTKFTLCLLMSAIGFFSFAQSYCTFSSPPYSSDQPGITNFKIGTINRTSPNVESNVVVQTGLTVTLTIGQTYSISLTHSEDQVSGPPLTGARNNIRIWIDYNNDFTFSTSGQEVAVSTDSQTPNTTYTTNITIPSTITAGTTRMRITAKMSDDAGHTIPTPCNSPADPLGYHGEIEDYTIVFVSPSTGISKPEQSSIQASFFPNPLNCNGVLQYNLPSGGLTSVNVFDMLGRKFTTLLNEHQEAGTHTVTINKSTNLKNTSGIYFIEVVSGNSNYWGKIVVND
jgi:hypothetical protein